MLGEVFGDMLYVAGRAQPDSRSHPPTIALCTWIDNATANDAPTKLEECARTWLDVELTPSARSVLDDALSAGRGVVLASAHLGPWERVARAIRDAGYPFVAVARETWHPVATHALIAMRHALGVPCLLRGGTTSGLAMVRALRQGSVVGIPCDLHTRAPSVPHPWFGAPATVAVGPARLARLARAPVVVATVAPADGGLWHVTAEPVDTANIGPGPAGDATLAGRIADGLQRRIACAPELWLWSHARYEARGPQRRPRT
jgi:KDO2-lipid IV(A) lauroyltransferase